MNVLALETSCDETAAAVVGASGVLSDVVHTQLEHAPYGGVVPEIAARAHAERIGPVVTEALRRAGIERPDAVAATAGPGLIGALLVGLSAGKALAAGFGVPFIGVNHLNGHILAPLLDSPAPQFPWLSLIVSGGHSAVYAVRGPAPEVEILGETIDDAAGEAFDKVARMLGLGWPGGPVVDKLAQSGDPHAVVLPRPKAPGLDLSFAGLKTAVRTHLQKPGRASDADVCASFQRAAVDCLLDRVQRAAAQTGYTRIAIGGGVAANSELRRRITTIGLEAFIPPKHRCTDNAAMIALAGRNRLLSGRVDAMTIAARPSWPPGSP